MVGGREADKQRGQEKEQRLNFLLWLTAECRVLIPRLMVYFLRGECGTVSVSEVEKVQSLNSSIPEIQHVPRLKMALPGALVSGWVRAVPLHN